MRNFNISYKITFYIFLLSFIVIAVFFILIKININLIVLLICIPFIIALLVFPLLHRFFSPIKQLYESIRRIQDLDSNSGEMNKSTGKIDTIEEVADEVLQFIKYNFASMYDLHNEVAETNDMNKNLRIRLNHLQKLFENANTAIFIYNIDGFIIEVNKKACEVLGYLREELMKFSFYQLQTETALHQSTEAYKTSDDSLSLRYESVFRHKTGRNFPVEISTSAIDLDAGIMQSMVNDITQRKEIETELKNSEDRFRTFMETASDFMFITDAEGQFIYVNKAMVASVGYPKDILLELGIQDLLETNEKTDIKNIFDSWLSGEKQKEIKLKTRRKDILWGEIQIVGIYTDKKVFRGIRGIIRDITERKKIEESQRLAQLGKLAADVAHGIKNQLTAMIYLAEMAVMEETDIKNVQEPVQQILDQCWEINTIVRRLLNFSTPSTGDFQPVNIHSIIDFVVGLVEKQYQKNEVKITKKYDSSLPHLTVDDKQMRDVFMNLIQNAYEAINGMGTINITTTKLGEFVQIDFQDTGGGINDEEIKRIFDPFFTTKKDGTGLGVSACYGILRAHGGNLKYSSKEGEGTTATVLLPILPPKAIKKE